MKSVFTQSIYEAIVVVLLVGYLFRSLSLLLHLGDIMQLIPSIIQLVVFILLFVKSQHLSYWMKIWAIYLVISGGVSFVSKLLLGMSREQYPVGVEWKVMIILSGILILWIARKRVTTVDESNLNKN